MLEVFFSSTPAVVSAELFVGRASRALSLVLGVLGGSILWWMMLTGVVARIRHFFAARTVHRVNVAAGAVIAGFGFYELATGIMMAAPWLF